MFYSFRLNAPTCPGRSWSLQSWGSFHSFSGLPYPQCISYHSPSHTYVCHPLSRQAIGSARTGPLPHPIPSPGPGSEQGLGKCFLKDPDARLPCLPASARTVVPGVPFPFISVQLCSHWARPSTSATFPRMSFLSHCDFCLFLFFF